MEKPTYSKSYTLIPLTDLDRVRKTALREMHELADRRGVNMKMRTFYLGSRTRQFCNSSTRKENATGAKLAFYKVGTVKTWSGSETGWQLVGYY